MIVNELLTELAHKGVHLQTQDGKLIAKAPQGVLTPEMRATLALNKDELLVLLEQNANRTDIIDLPQVMPDPAHRHDPFPLTDIQQAYWVGHTGVIELGSAMHIYSELESADLDLERFAVAWQTLIDRHEMLRAIILSSGDQQILAQVPPYDIDVQDLRGQPPDAVEGHLGAVRERLGHQVLPLDQWPPFEVCACRLDHGRTRLFMSIDCTFIDSWGLQILFRELIQLS